MSAMERSGFVTWESFKQALSESVESFPDTVVIGADGSELYLLSNRRTGSSVNQREHVQREAKAEAAGG